MGKKLDSTTLFLAQVNNHLSELQKLLAMSVETPVDDNATERAVLSTSMLASSSSLLDLNDWQVVLGAFEHLLKTYKNKLLCWDERIAQATSEIIEKEEHLLTVSRHQSPPDLQAAVPSAEMRSLLHELTELRAYAQSAPMNRTPPPLRPAAAAGATRQTPAAASARPAAEDEPVAVEIPADGSMPSRDQPLRSSIESLRKRTNDLLTQWQSSRWDFRSISLSAFEQIRRDLALVDFYALAIEQTIKNKTGDHSGITIESLRPVRVSTEDFAHVLCSGTDRNIDIVFEGEDNAADVRMLFPVQRVLQSMIGDIFVRCDQQELRVEVAIERKHGCLLWSVRDNGDNFITDSRLDPDEYLAFYPGLKETCRVLTELHSVLWVEASQPSDSRFAFTVPVSPEGGSFVVWRTGGKALAVLSSQFCETVPAGEAASDSRGEHLKLDGNRVPIIRLGQLYSGAPLEGDRIAVIGSLEKRIGLYVDGDPKVQKGKWRPDAVPAWKGLDQGAAQIQNEKIPLVEANGLLKRYMAVMNDSRTPDVSGVGTPDEAPKQEAAPTPPTPQPTAENDGAEVLVVEASADVRQTFASILSSRRLRFKLVEDVGAALSYIDKNAPSIIISEFRLPSMAAKVLVEKLKEEGKKIPVLVTTTHQGDNAELLTTKLGAAGYISKPLKDIEVWNRLEDFLGEEVSPGRAR